jgi:hypothetical protein
MTLFNRLAALAQTAVDKTNEAIETTKQNAAIGSEKAKVEELKFKIGEYYFKSYASGATLEDEPAELCLQIKAHEDKIASIEAELQAKKEAELQAKKEETQQVRAETSATEGIFCCCGVTNAPNTKFCRECGAKLEASPPPAELACECGVKYLPGTKFCGECGKRLEG